MKILHIIIIIISKLTSINQQMFISSGHMKSLSGHCILVVTDTAEAGLLREPSMGFCSSIIVHNMILTIPRDGITWSKDDWVVQSPPKRKVFRFHYHSQKVSGSI